MPKKQKTKVTKGHKLSEDKIMSKSTLKDKHERGTSSTKLTQNIDISRVLPTKIQITE